MEPQEKGMDDKGAEPALRRDTPSGFSNSLWRIRHKKTRPPKAGCTYAFFGFARRTHRNKTIKTLGNSIMTYGCIKSAV
ncbi:uncharacterized protein LOC143260708 isoform X2 [Megalopta genalis]|uniref:uncharacterized protein LOC143260708 isoform X2 n=1 Tax=Megalopta genalis TaxID=115081 RepID=UPI003FD29B90